MNLIQFLEHTDVAVAKLSNEKLTEFIHEVARNLPEDQREPFLIKLKELSSPASTSKKRVRENLMQLLL